MTPQQKLDIDRIIISLFHRWVSDIGNTGEYTLKLNEIETDDFFEDIEEAMIGVVWDLHTQVERQREALNIRDEQLNEKAKQLAAAAAPQPITAGKGNDNPVEKYRGILADAPAAATYTAGSVARAAAKKFCVFTSQEHSTEETLAAIIQSVLAKKDCQIDALLDAINALKGVVDDKRHDHEKIASIINGALAIGDERALDAAFADGWELDTSPGTETSNQRWYRRCPTQLPVSEETLIDRYFP